MTEFPLKSFATLSTRHQVSFLKRLYSDFGYICHLYTRNKLLIKTNATYIKANFQCKTMQVDFKRDFVGEKCCQRWDSNQRSSILEHLALGVTHSCRFFTSLSLSQAKNCQLPVATIIWEAGNPLELPLDHPDCVLPA